jgi:hypothetical protein
VVAAPADFAPKLIKPDPATPAIPAPPIPLSAARLVIPIRILESVLVMAQFLRRFWLLCRIGVPPRTQCSGISHGMFRVEPKLDRQSMRGLSWYSRSRMSTPTHNYLRHYLRRSVRVSLVAVTPMIPALCLSDAAFDGPMLWAVLIATLAGSASRAAAYWCRERQSFARSRHCAAWSPSSEGRWDV